MAILNHNYSKTPALNQFALIYFDTFPEKSLLFGTDARKFCEIVYTPKATKTGGGFGSVIVDEYGVPSIVGAPGEYSFTWYVNDKTDGQKYGPYTCIMTNTAWPDVTAPIVSITTSGPLLDLRPALVGTVNDASARVVVSISNKDYVAINDGVGGWSIPINTIDQIPIDITTVTIRAIDSYDNVGSASTTIYYNGSQYFLIHDFDVSTQSTALGWIDGQDVGTFPSSIGQSALSTTNVAKPSYVAADKSLSFTTTPADRLANTSLEPFREIFVVLDTTGLANLFTVFQMRSTSGLEPAFYTGSTSTQWRFNNTNVSGKIANAKQVLHVRYINGSAIISTNGGSEQTVAAASVSEIDITKLYIHDGNFNGATMKLHEIATTPKLNSAQRAAVITDLKTKWGIA